LDTLWLVLDIFELHNAVVHMLAGKAIARAVRAHLIVDAALNALVLSNTMDPPPYFLLHDAKKQNLHWKRLQLISALEMLISKKPTSYMKT
jgi:hypothetical protein